MKFYKLVVFSFVMITFYFLFTYLNMFFELLLSFSVLIHGCHKCGDSLMEVSQTFWLGHRHWGCQNWEFLQIKIFPQMLNFTEISLFCISCFSDQTYNAGAWNTKRKKIIKLNISLVVILNFHIISLCPPDTALVLTSDYFHSIFSLFPSLFPSSCCFHW